MAKMGKVTVEVELQMRFGGHRALLIDLDSGDWLIPTTLEPGDGFAVAASVLPGWPAELIAAAYGEWMGDDPALPEPLTADSYGLIPDVLAALLATAQVTKSEWHTLRDTWGRDWTAIANEIRSRLDTVGKYQER